MCKTNQCLPGDRRQPFKTGSAGFRLPSFQVYRSLSLSGLALVFLWGAQKEETEASTTCGMRPPLSIPFSVLQKRSLSLLLSLCFSF